MYLITLNHYVKITIQYLDKEITLTKYVPLLPENTRYRLSFIHAYQLPAFEFCINLLIYFFTRFCSKTAYLFYRAILRMQ